MSSPKQMVSLEEALRVVDESLAGAKVADEGLPVREAAGRVLAGEARSRLDLPPFDKSAMDGYAISAGDERETYRLLETVPAGRVGTARLVPGACVKVMTGAPVPEGAARVVPIEHVALEPGVVRILERDGKTNICPRAEDVGTGDLVLPAGRRLGAVEIANLVACGVTEVRVARRVRLAILSTGDEIVDSPDEIRPGRIMNSNGPLLALLAREHGLEVAGEASVPDDPGRTAAALRESLARAEIVTISGGVSVGDFDFVAGALADVGLALRFTSVASKPGRPMTYATGRGKAVFGLPGNPVSVFVAFYVFVLRAAARLTGACNAVREFRLSLGRDFKRARAERAEFVPCRLAPGGEVVPVEYHGSAHLAALLEADGFFVVPAGAPALKAGEEVAFLPTARWAG